MRAILEHWRPLSYLLIVALLSFSVPRHHAEAAIVTTESLVDLPGEGHVERERVRAFLKRPEVRAQLEAYGISPEEASARVESLTDREIAVLASQLDQLPAAGNDGLTALFAAVFAATVVVLVGVGLAIWHLGKWTFEKVSGSDR